MVQCVLKSEKYGITMSSSEAQRVLEEGCMQTFNYEATGKVPRKYSPHAVALQGTGAFQQ